MTISRMQEPRQLYGLGSLVKSIGKGITGAVKGVARGAKKFAKSDIGKAAIDQEWITSWILNIKNSTSISNICS